MKLLLDKRRVIFSAVLSTSIAIDMFSTLLVLKLDNLHERTGIIQMMLDVSPFLLIVWAVLWGLLLYITHPLLEKKHFDVHAETIAIIYSFTSVISAIGNFYLWFKLK